jgi:hypothetical protein
MALLVAFLPSAAAAPSEKYLPDDTDAVVVVNVKQVLASELFPKLFKKYDDPYDLGIGAYHLKNALREFGIDPLKDIDRLTVVQARSSLNDQREAKGDGPMAILGGRFDAAKVRAAVEKLVKDKRATIHKHGDAILYESRSDFSGLNLYLAVLDKETLFAALRRGPVEDALDKAAGKKKTALKNKNFAELYAQLKESDTLAAALSGEMRLGKTVSADGKKVEFMSAGDQGIKTVTISAKVEAKLTFTVAATFKDKDTTASMEKEARRSQKESLGLEKSAPALARAIKAIAVTTKDNTITLAGQMDAEGVRELAIMILLSINPISR